MLTGTHKIHLQSQYIQIFYVLRVDIAFPTQQHVYIFKELCIYCGQNVQRLM